MRVRCSSQCHSQESFLSHPDVSAILGRCSGEQLVVISQGCDFKDQMTQPYPGSEARLWSPCPCVPGPSGSGQRQGHC